MTLLYRLQVSGIRLFDPDKPEVLKFCPLTLILGVNGAGKTTLIEALRYATSGETPPGSDKGKLWITDPTLLAKSVSQVRAQVRLKFSASDGSVMQILRSMELNVKRDSRTNKTSTSFKTLESMLIKYDKDNNKETTLNSRCAEIDKEMLTLAGVSQAVLTNVIFCHQEDNCWPLSEGKILKEKFDQIFGSIGYVKALEKIKKYRAKRITELKTLEALKDKFAEIREQKKKNEKEKTRHTREMESQRIDKTELENKLKPIEKELEKLAAEESGISETSARIAKLNGQLQEKVRSVTELEAQIRDKFDGSLSDLDEKESAFRAASSVTDKTKTLSSQDAEIRKLDVAIKTDSNRVKALLIQQGKMDQQEDNFRADLKARDDYVSALMSDPVYESDAEMQVDGDDDMADADGKFEKLVSFLQSKVKKLMSESQDSKREKEAAVSKLMKEVEELKISKAKAQQTIKMKEESQQKRDSEMKNLLAKVAKVESTAGTIVEHSDEILAAVNDLKKKLQDESDAADVEDKVSCLKLTQCELQEQIMDLKKMNHQLVRDCVSSVTEIRKEVKEIDDRLKQLLEQLSAEQKNLKASESSEMQEIDKLKEAIRKLDSLQRNVAKHSGTEEKSSKFKADIETATANLQSMKDRIATLESEKAAIQKEVAESEVVLRSFSDNRRLLNLKQEIAVVNEQLIGLEKKMPVTDVSALERKRRDLNKESERIREKIGAVKGRMQSAQQESARLEQELNTPKYQTADREFKKAIVNVVVQESMVDDLNKYYQVLDHAVSKYHVRRMQQINQLIGHYWRTTYQGTDIKTIKIACDESEERSADKRRSFNYRVVMVKKDSEIDMRGRCSAGQKVLASLVIRIALAQVFCVNCSILTLDEPTTNLDKANVEALARAICNIVEDQKGKIQIVIITHDPEFLKYLNEEFSEFYYEVSKGENGFSHITKKFLRERE